MEQPHMSFDDLHASAKNAQAASHLFEGGKFVFAKPMTENFQISHNFEFSQPSQYLFNATYYDFPEGVDPQQGGNPKNILVGNIDSNGGLVARMCRYWGNLQTAAVFQQFSHQGQSQMLSQFEATYAATDFNAALKVAEPDIVNSTGVAIFSYLQSVSRKLALGGQLRYTLHGPFEEAAPSVGFQYKGDDQWQAQATIEGNLAAGVIGFETSYVKKINPTTSLYLDFEGQVMGESKLSAGYEAMFQQALVRGQFTANGDVVTTVERKLGPNMSFKFGGSLNHKTNEQHYGLGFFIGGA